MNQNSRKSIGHSVWARANELSGRIRDQIKGKKTLFEILKLGRLSALEGMTTGLIPGVYLIAADTNVGKTSLLTSLTLDLCEHNPNVCVVYLSFDDDYWEVHNRLVANSAGLPIGQALMGNFETPEMRREFLGGTEKLTALRNERRLLIVETQALADLGDGENLYAQTMSALPRFISEETALNKGRRIVICIDNVSNLNSFNPSDLNDSTGALILGLQRIAKTTNIPIICTTESSDREGKVGKPRGARTNSFASRMVFNLREPKRPEVEGYIKQLQIENERLLILDTQKNKCSGLGKIRIPLAIHDEFGRARTLTPIPDLL